jgi:carbamoyl-phosphate synthase large subunit
VGILKILVTGTGGGAGQSILKALRLANYEDVLAFDSAPLAAGLYFGYPGVVGFNALNPKYIPHLLSTSIKNGVDIIFPGHDIELKILTNVASTFRDNGIRIIVSEPKVIEICDDKLKTAQFLAEAGFDFPITQAFHNFEWGGYPVVLKPQFDGARSKDTYIARTFEEFTKFVNYVNHENCIVQEYIEGDEYTCGSIYLDDGLLGVVSMKRQLRNGDTYKAFSIDSKPLNAFVGAVVSALKPYGACNVQLRIRNNKPYVFEINPRCSGTTAARALVGFNEPHIILNFLAGESFPKIDYKEKTILRFWEEVVIENTDVLPFPNDKSTENSAL